MRIKIAHLYYDLLNLYGEIGNIISLKNALEYQNVKADIINLSINDSIDFNKYDFIYIGSGTEDNILLALNHLKKYKKELKRYIEDNKFFLSTGNSLDLFGSFIKNNGLKLFDYSSSISEKRIVNEVICKSKLSNKEIIGFYNHAYKTTNIESPFFEIEQLNIKDGIIYNNFYGTHILGPILVRNPHLLEYIVMKLILQKDKNFKFKKFNFSLENKAYNLSIKNLKQ
ncbi:MAG: glutamine amidotransferase [Clostridium sp.]|nr:glutamine amidotransferase [Clostridium sp.]MCM1444453.1 hypothetical protein [Candidatus Amulumruptor caecigallinarius]